VIGSEIPKTGRSYDDFLALADGVSDATGDALAAQVTPHDLLLIQFTSGTTAYPKAVMLTHDNMLRNAWAVGQRIGIRPDDRYFNCRPFFHVAGTTLSLLVSLIAGTCLVTLPTFEAGAALAMMERERCTLTSGNDTLFQMMMGNPSFDPAKLCLRGGWSAAGPETVRNIIEKMGARDVCIAYGLSEASPNVVLNDYHDDVELRIAGLAKPLDGVEVRIMADGKVQPSGATGAIEVRGWNVMRGYYKNPEETAKVLSPEGWLRTGDLGVLDRDGRLRMVGRLKDVFRVGGENVAPAEVEEVLLSHPAVATAQVVGVPDTRLGEVGAAFVTLKGGAQASEAEIAAFMKARCANFRVPRYVAVVESFDAIGMTASGKVQKNRLRDHAIERFGLGARGAPGTAQPATTEPAQ
jgi:fatty-acyl-CoA synthase